MSVAEQTDSNTELIREPVVAWAVLRVKRKQHHEDFMWLKPLSVAPDGMTSGDSDFDNKDEIVGVVPAAPGTCIVYGPVCGKFEDLGIEVPWGDPVDWSAIIKEREEVRGGSR